jgi:hypothetical protein
MSAAEAKIKEIERIKADIRILHIRSMEKIKSELTSEQRKKISSLMEMRQMGRMGMGMMGDKHGKYWMMKGGRHMDGDDPEGGDGRHAPEPGHHHH